MTFDITKAPAMTRKAPSSKGRMTYAEAKAESIKNLDKAINDVKNFMPKNGGKLPTGNQMPAGLVKVGASGETAIGWRIANKPVHFDAESKAAYYACGDDWEAALKTLAAQIEANQHEDALLEAYERPTKEPSEFMLEKRAARNAAKQAGQATFVAKGNTYRTKDGKRA